MSKTFTLHQKIHAAALIAALLLLYAFNLPIHASDAGSSRAVYIAEVKSGEDADALKSAIKKLCPDAEFLYDYEYALDGFSFAVADNECYKLKDFGDIHIWEANAYAAPQPLDISSSAVIGADSKTLVKYRGEGMVIAVIDVGFNTGHEIFSLTNDNTAKLTADDVAACVNRGMSVSNWLAYEGTSPYVNAKIPFAYDYYSQTSELTGTADHGNHVAAIAAGNRLRATDPNAADGIAPEAQLLLMNVGDKSGKQLNDANIYAALEDAIRLGADVINISLGKIAGFGSTDMAGRGYDRVIKRAYERGIDVVCSAGNTSKLGKGSVLDTKYGITKPRASNPDYSVLSDPSGFPFAIAAAASVNTEYIQDNYISASGIEVIKYNAPPNSDFTKSFGGKATQYAVVPGLGEAADYDNINVKDKLALISRGALTFVEKLKNAAKAGAVGALIYDNTDSAELVNMAVDDGQIPCAAISKSDGLALAAEAAGDMTITVVTDKGKTMPAPNAGGMADYSSWGVTTDLRLKPDVTAPGSYIYSAFNDGYGTMSGTSMAAPHITGALAVIKQYLKTTDTSKLDEGERLALPRAMLMGTASPVYDKTAGADYSPRLQGAGRIDLAAAVATRAVMYNPETLEAKLELGDKLGDSFKLTFTVKNLSNRALDYFVEATAMTDGYEYIKYTDKDGSIADNAAADKDAAGDWFVTGDPKALVSASIKLSGGRGTELNANKDNFKRSENLRIPAGATETFTLDVTLDKTESAELDKIFTSGWFLDGFIKLTARDEGGINLSIPYMGFVGDWSDVNVFDEGGDFYNDLLCTGIIRENSLMLFELGMNALNKNETRSNRRYIISINDDGFYDFIGLRLSLLRNCKSGKCYVKDKNGEIVYKNDKLGLMQKAYYDSDEAALSVSYMNLLWDGSAGDNERYRYPDGEYILTIEVELESGKTQSRSFNFTVDTEKPKLGQYSFYKKDGRTYLRVTASDNTYLASVCVYTGDSAKETLDETRVFEADIDSRKVTEDFDVTDYVENEWLYVELIDFAFNITVCRVPTAGGGN